MSVSVILSLGLVVYLIFSLLKVLSLELTNAPLILTSLATIGFIIYFISAGIIYLKSMYNNAVVLLISVIAYFFQLIFSIINEFIYFERILTALIIVCHIGSIYLLMKFLLEATIIDHKIIEN
ncbi:hypothetical protein PW52_05720 [Tamlana sedimentorum]|uniref:Uncharacterized protein n=1 Tax=Neotamlana sedimentorum TaxID=1435349 RepID=A0A0D7WAC0_9FLAO|nr:hypothetical protein PW52_05720 [Tamlana sedimentorum]